MAEHASEAHSLPGWFVPPGEGDFLALVVAGLLIGALYGVVYLYAAFDRWAEHHSKETPLAKTIPTLLLIALLYEIFPLDHFHVLLPLAAILVALAADWSRFHLSIKAAAEDDAGPVAEATATGTGTGTGTTTPTEKRDDHV